MKAAPKVWFSLFALASLAFFGNHATRAQYIGSDSPVVVPKIYLRDGHVQCAGKAFAIQWFRNRKLLLMPLHLLGPGSGYPVYIAAENVPEEVKSIDALNLKGTAVVSTAGPGLLRTGVPVEKAMGDISGDLMAFELPSNSRIPLLALAPKLVPVGTKVWVLTKTDGSTTLETDRYSGKVVRSMPGGVTIDLDHSLTAMGSSGAPVVNEKNEVVCMMVGKQDLRRTTVMGIPSTSIYLKLYREIGR